MLRVRKEIVAIKPIFDPPKTAGGLFIPESAKERCDQGIVKYVGEGVTDVYYGDHVIFSAYDGTLARIDGEGLMIFLPAGKITAIIGPPHTVIEGVYFKSPHEPQELEHIIEKVAEIIDVKVLDEFGLTYPQHKEIAKEIVTYLLSQQEYFPATYEMSVEMIAEAITNAPWKSKYRFVDRMKTSPSESKVFE